MKKIYPLLLFLLILSVSGCYTIVNQPSVLPEDLRISLNEDGTNNAEITNNYYLYNGLYYNRPYYANRQNLRYDWFSNSYYYDPYYYNYNYYYDDHRWYYHRNRPSRSYNYGSSSVGSGTNVETVRRTTPIGRDQRNVATAPDPGNSQYIIKSSSTGNSSKSDTKVKESSSSSNDSKKSDNTTRTKKRKR